MTSISYVFSQLWMTCLYESLRETTYMAELAGKKFSLGQHRESLEASFYGYNDKLQPLVQEVLGAVRTHTVTKDFFENKKAFLIRALESEGKKEPYTRLTSLKNEVLSSHYPSTKELLRALKEELSFETFLELKAKWLRNVQTEWLIMGHVS
jgi:secreted Zn-dependent insulinase-like peptidase